MESQNDTKISKFYLGVVVLLMLIFPLLSVFIDSWKGDQQITFIELVGKWFTFWAIGVRLFTAGFRQAINPAFTAENILKIGNKDSFVIVRELGFANICFGSIGILSLLFPTWRPAAAFAGGLFVGIAGVNHTIRKPATANEWVAMASDNFIGLVMLAYLVMRNY